MKRITITLEPYEVDTLLRALDDRCGKYAEARTGLGDAVADEASSLRDKIATLAKEPQP